MQSDEGLEGAMPKQIESDYFYCRNISVLGTLAAAMLMASGCTISWSAPKSGPPEQNESELETLYVADKDKVSVQLTSADSARLKSVLVEKLLSGTMKANDFGAVTLLESQDKDLRIECGTDATPVTQSNCFVMFNVKPLDARNSTQYDEVSNEYMFQMLNPDAAREIYASLKVKEWDLQGSTYKRFSSSDNRMIFECILDAERSRCSVFLSEDGAVDESD
ncbi:MAG: hypothetical protein RJB13_2040 [Pseudomonadota bacterium]|jgi:hypothetical protein